MGKVLGSARSTAPAGAGVVPGRFRLLLAAVEPCTVLAVRAAVPGLALRQAGDLDRALAALAGGWPQACVATAAPGPGLTLLRRARDAGCGTPFLLLAGGGAAPCLRKAAAGLDARILPWPASQAALTAALEELGVLARAAELDEGLTLTRQAARDVLWDWDLRTGRISISERCQELLGVPGPVQITPQEWLERVHARDRSSLEQAVRDHLAGRTEVLECEHRVFHRDGRPLWVQLRGLAVRAPGGRAVRVAGSLTDVTSRRAAERRLLHDPLTGLPNRTLLQERLEQLLHRSRRQADVLWALLFLDLDGFKAINDRHGHRVGDRFLQVLGERLQTCLRPADTVARLGGDEFVVLLQDLQRVQDVFRVARRIQSALVQPVAVGSLRLRASSSIGIALGDRRFETAEDVLRAADSAMYRAKSAGKDRYELYDPEGHEEALYALGLERELRRALQRREFVLHFQPILALEDGRVRGLEALIRWQHPERGLLEPGEFLPEAEELGLMPGIGAWVLDEATGWLRRWSARLGPEAVPPLDVNLAPDQVLGDGFFEGVRRALAVAGLSPGHLRLELHARDLPELLGGFRRRRLAGPPRGVAFSVDEFGADAALLPALVELDVRAVKLARSLVQGLGRSAEAEALVQAVLAMAASLDLEVVAAGVEQPAQADRLRDLGCGLVQGFRFCRPLTGSAVAGYLAGKARHQGTRSAAGGVRAARRA